jgi:hypothetical protein
MFRFALSALVLSAALAAAQPAFADSASVNTVAALMTGMATLSFIGRLRLLNDDSCR